MRWNSMCYAGRGNLLAVAMAASVTLVGPAAYAVDKFWVDNSNQSWPSAANWSPSGQPGTADTAIFNLGSVTPPYPVLFLSGFNPINAVADRLRIDSSPITFTPTQSTLTIDGTNITETARALVIGRTGSGTPNGQLDSLLGQLNATYATLGEDAGSSGTLNVNAGAFNVTGVNAVWDLIVGLDGAGTINVNNGADVTVADDAVLGKNAGSSGSISVSGEGTVWDGESELHIGDLGAGAVTVSSGADFLSAHNYLARQADSTAVATITGAGSFWNCGSIYVGYLGEATLDISAGGDLSAGNAFIGYGAGSSGEAVVSGNGSSWFGGNALTVGGSGTGSLTISSGGVVTDLDGIVGNSGQGTVLVQGSGSRWTNSDELRIGHVGSGEVNILNGGQLTAASAMLGNQAGSTATMLVSGSFARCTINGPLTVGNLGQASLTVDGWSALFDQNGPMTINAGGEVEVGADAVFDLGAEPLTINGGALTVFGSGDVTFGAGSLLNGADIHVSMIQSTLTHTGELAMAGGTSLTVTGGAQYRPSFTQVGTSPGSPASVLVTDVGTSTIASFAIDIGYGGEGEFTVTGGATVNAPNSAVGSFAPGSIGTLTIDGTGPGGQRSTWISNNGPNVGYHAKGHGTISVLNGGLLRSSGMDVGVSGPGTIIIDGAASPSIPSLLDMLGNLLLYRADVTASNGGRIQAGHLDVASFSAGPATLTIEGNGSMLQQNGASTTTIGNASAGSAEINVQNNATFITGTGAIAVNATGAINIESGGVFDARGPILMNGGAINLLGGTLHVDTFTGNLINQAGTLAPGHSPGTTAVSGNYTQQSGATLEIEIGGVFPGDWDEVTVQGNALLNGTLRVVLIDGFQPVVGNTFTILTTNVGNIGGAFATLDLPAGMEVIYTSTSVRLEMTSQPNPCPPDINNSGFVDVDDLIAVILSWGCTNPPGPCDADIDDSGVVDVDDLIAVILAWGACP